MKNFLISKKAYFFLGPILFLILTCPIFPIQLLYSSDTSSNPVVLIVGTRPEAIKMAPIYNALKTEKIPVVLCSTAQHAELLDSALDVFQLKPDYDLQIMIPGQDLFHVTQSVLEKTKKLFQEIKPSLVVVQGDTTSAMSAALAAFYLKIPIAHVEAGLRTGNMQAPFPEELNRRLISLLATYHFTPTEFASSNLIAEGINSQNIFCTGNTIVDALHKIRDKIHNSEVTPSESIQTLVTTLKKDNRPILLLTAHRRESFKNGLNQIFSAVKLALHRYPNLYVIYPQHPNPEIRKILEDSGLNDETNISISPPLSYIDMVYLLLNVDCVMTDSGGIQEEAVSLNKPVFILRNETDRPEGVMAGKAVLVGTNKQTILDVIDQFMNGTVFNNSDIVVYGDGTASEKITNIIKNHLASEIAENENVSQTRGDSSLKIFKEFL